MKLPGASASSVPPLSKSLLPRVELTETSSGRRWWMSVPGPVAVPKSPCDLAQTCSRFHWPTPPPLALFGSESPVYRRITLEELAGSSSVSFSASQTWL